MGTEKKHKNSWRKKKWAEEQRQREGEREIELKEAREGKGGCVGERCAERSARGPQPLVPGHPVMQSVPACDNRFPSQDQAFKFKVQCAFCKCYFNNVKHGET